MGETNEKIAEFNREDWSEAIFEEFTVPDVYHHVRGWHCTDPSYENEYSEMSLFTIPLGLIKRGMRLICWIFWKAKA